MTRFQVPLVCIASFKTLLAVHAFERCFTRVSAEVLFEVRWMPELSIAFLTRESRGVVVDQHVILKRMLSGECGITRAAREWLNAGVTPIMRDQGCSCGKCLVVVANLALQHEIRFGPFAERFEAAKRHLTLPAWNHSPIVHFGILCSFRVH